MRKPSSPSIRIAAVIAIAVASAVATTGPAVAADPETAITVAVAADGTPSWNASDGVGEDSGPANGRVRTLDYVTYEVEFQFNGLTGHEKTVTLTLDNAAWTEVPPSCGSGAISSDGHTLDCTVAVIEQAGAVGTITADALVGAVQDGSVLTMTAQSHAGPVSSPIESATTDITALPRWDLALNYGSHVAEVDHPVSGDRIYVIATPVTVEADISINEGKGTEGLTGHLDFTIDYAAFGAPDPGVELVDFAVPGIDWMMPCSAVNSTALSPEVPMGSLDFETLAGSAVEDSGVWSCTQASPGQPIDVTVTGASLSPSVFPFRTAQQFPLTPRKISVSGYVTTFVTEADLQAMLPGGGGEITFEAAVSGFDPIGLSGGSNYDTGTEPTWNNVAYFTLTTYPPGNWDAFYMNEYRELDAPAPGHPGFGPGIFPDMRPAFMNPEQPPFVPGQTQQDHAGDGVVSFGQKYDYIAQRQNTSTHLLPDNQVFQVMCVFVDTTTNLVVDSNPYNRWLAITDDTSPLFGHNSGPPTVLPAIGAPARVVSTPFLMNWGPGQLGPTPAVDHVIEYGTGPIDPTTGCGDTASATGWTTDPGTTAGASGGEYPAISMVRVRTTEPIGIDEMIELRVTLTPRAGLSAGDRLVTYSNYGTWETGAWNGQPDQWYLTNQYDPDTHSNVHAGDRLYYADRTLTVTKAVTDNKSVSLKPGDIVTYQVTGTIVGAQAPLVTLTDTLPVGMEFVDADVAPSAISGQDVEWQFTDVAGTVTVNYRVRVTPDAPNGQPLTNVVVGDAAGLAQNGNGLTSSTTVATRRAFVQLDVWKTTDFDVVEIVDPIGFGLTSQNTANTTLHDLDLIDILPYVGDGRGSDFTGGYALSKPIVAGSGVVLRATDHPPADIDADPDHVSNGDGTVTWCAETDFGTGSCPGSWADVTALRVQKGTLAPDEMIAVSLELVPDSNRDGDVYANGWQGRTSDVSLLARSEEVAVEVIAGSITPRAVCVDDARQLDLPVVIGDWDGVTGMTVDERRSGTYEVEFDLTGVEGTVDDNKLTVQLAPGEDVEAVLAVTNCRNLATTTTTTTTAPTSTTTPETTTTAAASPNSESAPPPGPLAFTGSSIAQLVTAALALVATGTALFASTRRRARC